MVDPKAIVIAGMLAIAGPPPGVHRHEADLPQDHLDSTPAEPEPPLDPRAQDGPPDLTHRPPSPPDPNDDALPNENLPATGPSIHEAILPIGLRVLAGRDSTLPVAAVILAIEIGTKDDPPAVPGLVHALAYHLLQGNRELPPLGAAQIVHDAGGHTSLAIGAGQVRYESVLPLSILEDALWTEAQRLRAPTVNETTWETTLRIARRNAKKKKSPAMVREAMALAFGGSRDLAHDGFAISEALEALSGEQVGRLLADSFAYDRATLVVVSPLEPSEVVARIRKEFDDLPPSPRAHLSEAAPPPSEGSVPPLELEGPAEDRFLFPLPPRARDRGPALVLCDALNRQEPAKGEGARLKCEVDGDPRRGALWIRVTKSADGRSTLSTRLERLRQPAGTRLLEASRRAVATQLKLEVSSPLGLARHLAVGDPESTLAVTTEGSQAQSRDVLIGLDTLANPDAIATHLPMSADTGILLRVRPRTRGSRP